MLFSGEYITKYKDKVTLKSKDAYVDKHAGDAGRGGLRTPMVRKESAANGDEDMLEGPEAETYRSVVGILMYFKRHRFTRQTNQRGHMRRLKRVLRYIQGTRDVHLELVRPQEQLTEMVGWCDKSWADLDEKRRSTTGGLLMLGGACRLVSNAETISDEQW